MRYLPILLALLVWACAPQKPAETPTDTTAVEVTTPAVTQPTETKPSAPPPDNGQWDGDLTYVLNIPNGSVKEKNIVVVMAVDNEETSRHEIFKTFDGEGGTDPIYIISQPVVAMMLDTAMVYSEGLQQTELCFVEATWYNIEFEDRYGTTYTGWVPDNYGVYSVYETEIGGQPYSFEGIQDSLWLGAMYPMELDLRYVNKDYDYAAADNCRDITPLFFYNDNRIYMIGGSIEDNWSDPAFNTSQSHLAIIGLIDNLEVRRNPKSVKLTFKKDSKQKVAVVANRGRLKIDSVYNYRY